MWKGLWVRGCCSFTSFPGEMFHTAVEEAGAALGDLPSGLVLFHSCLSNHFLLVCSGFYFPA